MKPIFKLYSLILLLFIFLILSHNTSARLLQTKKGYEEEEAAVKLDNQNIEESESFEVMGLEKCENGDEECHKRRAIAEVHLDYIYNQQLKP